MALSVTCQICLGNSRAAHDLRAPDQTHRVLHNLDKPNILRSYDLFFRERSAKDVAKQYPERGRFDYRFTLMRSCSHGSSAQSTLT